VAFRHSTYVSLHAEKVYETVILTCQENTFLLREHSKSSKTQHAVTPLHLAPVCICASVEIFSLKKKAKTGLEMVSRYEERGDRRGAVDSHTRHDPVGHNELSQVRAWIVETYLQYRPR
jgi:hypothetical protein